MCAPFGPGVYDVRLQTTGEAIKCGSGKNVAERMTSLLPGQANSGSRNNKNLQAYMLEQLDNIEYRTLACETESRARLEEANQKASMRYKFP